MKLPLKRWWEQRLDAFAQRVAAAVPVAAQAQHPRAAVTPAPSHRNKLDELEAIAEWEPLHSGILDLAVTRVGRFTGHLGTVTLTRNEEYGIVVVFRTTLNREALEELTSSETGRLTKGIPLEAADPFGVQLQLLECVIGHYTLTWSVHAPPSATVEVHTSSVNRTFAGQSLDRARSTTEWYLSGPEQFPYPRRTRRERHQRFIRRRHSNAGNEDVPTLVRLPVGKPHDEQVSFDYMRLLLNNNVLALVTNVPEKFRPTWSEAIGIEYHYAAGLCPDSNTRDMTSDAVGFLLGRHLLRVGRSTYDEEGYPVEEYACNPWGRDVVRTCASNSLPPFRIARKDLEDSYTGLVNSYLTKCQQLDLRDVVWTCWIAQRMPLGFELPLYSSALERLMQAWFKSARSRSKGVYMAKSEFDRVLVDVFTSARSTLGDRTYADRIMRRLQGSFQMSVNERFEVFFDELSLAVGVHENRAIRARNASAHGGKSDAADTQERVRLARTYQTLLNRVILKVLGHTGTYTDYSAEGHPEKPLNQPLGPL